MPIVAPKNALPTAAAPADGQLTAAMVRDFRDAGVLVLTDFVSVDECNKLRRHVSNMVEAFDADSVGTIFSAMKQTQLGDKYFEESGDKIRYFFEHDAFDSDGCLAVPKAESLNKMGHAMHDLDPVFDAFSRTPKLAAVVDSVGYKDPVLIQSMYIFKPPRIGGEVYCHQDSTFLYTEPESCLGFWFALEDATEDNGCMHFIPGGHKGPLKELHFRGSDGNMTFKTLDDTPWPENATAAAEVNAGSLVIFDGRAPHMSGANLSDKSRHAYTLHVIERASRYPAENWLQRPGLPLRGFH